MNELSLLMLILMINHRKASLYLRANHNDCHLQRQSKRCAPRKNRSWTMQESGKRATRLNNGCQTTYPRSQETTRLHHIDVQDASMLNVYVLKPSPDQKDTSLKQRRNIPPRDQMQDCCTQEHASA